MKKYSVYIWALLTVLFIAFIGLMSYWYPVTLDEYFRWQNPFDFIMIKKAYFEQVPRISTLFSPPIFILGKWFFILFNSLIQFANCLCIFYILFVRLPNVKKLQDMPYFVIILCMSIFFVCSPSEIMFWISGAVNYSWNMFFLLLLFCFLRQIQTQKFMLKDNLFAGIFVFLLAFIVGMSNEALSPIAFGFIICFGLYCYFKKIKTPRVLSFMIFGLTIGCLIFFSAPAHYYKMTNSMISNLSSVTLSQKLFFHIFHFNEFFKAQFFLPLIVSLFLLIAALDKDKRNFKSENFWYSVSFLFTGFLMAFVLFIVPTPPLRAYYPASVMNILAFLFLVRYYIETYNYDFSKILCYVVLIVSLCFAPRFIIPHYALHLQEKEHNTLNIEVPCFVLKGPTANLSIGFMDPARRIEIAEGVFVTDISPLENW